mmetsp:Transcript_65101/g.135706  ORF Transcript_65101/g.135706 Transcript_65101/m.135706 type:complete len:300 (+) Transcript_65101:988-1887(+)
MATQQREIRKTFRLIVARSAQQAHGAGTAHGLPIRARQERLRQIQGPPLRRRARHVRGILSTARRGSLCVFPAAAALYPRRTASRANARVPIASSTPSIAPAAVDKVTLSTMLSAKRSLYKHSKMGSLTAPLKFSPVALRATFEQWMALVSAAVRIPSAKIHRATVTRPQGMTSVPARAHHSRQRLLRWFRSTRWWVQQSFAAVRAHQTATIRSVLIPTRHLSPRHTHLPKTNWGKLCSKSLTVLGLPIIWYQVWRPAHQEAQIRNSLEALPQASRGFWMLLFRSLTNWGWSSVSTMRI